MGADCSQPLALCLVSGSKVDVTLNRGPVGLTCYCLGVYSASREFHEPDVPPEILLEVVYDVEAYPDFVKGINGVTVKNRGPNNIVAEFDADMGAMKFRYTLLIEREAGVVRWRRLAGAFRANEGSMVHLGDGHYRYKNAMDPGFAVPGFAVRFVLERSLPRLIKELRARAHERVTGS